MSQDAGVFLLTSSMSPITLIKNIPYIDKTVFTSQLQKKILAIENYINVYNYRVIKYMENDKKKIPR